MALERYGGTSSAPSVHAPITEFDVLKSSHRFLRSEEEEDKQLTWNDKLAKKYYNSLYREFAVCDLKHYKSGNFSLRWRTEAEVLSGAGDSTCGNTRCRHHSPEPGDNTLRLNTVELPFAYVEHGEHKSALVKMVLCDKCTKKLMYKRSKDAETGNQVKKEEDLDDAELLGLSIDMREGDKDERTGSKSRKDSGKRRRHEEDPGRRRQNSRSRSPRRRRKSHSQRSPPT